jgi:hypothetical protein
MYKTFKTRTAIFSPHHLALAFTLVVSFFCNTLLKAASVEVDINLVIAEGQSGQNHLFEGGLVTYRPQTAEMSYNFNIAIGDFPSNVEGITINFGNGRTEFMALSGAQKPVRATFNVVYGDFSEKRVTITELFQDNRPAASWGSVVNRIIVTPAIYLSTYKTPDETVAISGINMHIKYAPSNTQRKLNKPIIFVEGIDFDKSVVKDVTGKPVRVGDFGWDTFITGKVDNPASSDNQTFAMLPDFVNQMLSDGYDIVFCDFQNGTDFIEANGRALINVINEVNQRKKSGLTAKQRCFTNTVIGASMGGQVVRWALKTMENENTDHDSNLYLSMDSPHKGANIPLGLQAFIWFGANNGPMDGKRKKMATTWEGINSPAARQLLAFNLGSSSEHPTYIKMMSDLGYPLKTRNVASANGSGSGQNQGYTSDALMASARGTISALGTQVSILDLNLRAAGASNIIQFFRVLDPPSRDNLGTIQLGKMALDKSSNKSVVLSSWVGKTNLVSAASLAYATTRTITFDKEMAMWDNAPGGNRNDVSSELLKGVWEGLDGYGRVKTEPTGKQCFIPTVSALDLTTSDMHTNASTFVQDINNPINTPFKRVYMSNTNEPHVFMSPGLLTFARNEIIANTKVSCGVKILPGPGPTPIGL